MTKGRADSMRLSDETSSIAITLDGWEFPGDEGEESWPVLGLSLKDPRGAWKATGAIVTLEEVRWLAAWLSSLARSRPASREIRFLEPNLEFEQIQRTEDDVQIRIRLDGPCLPP